MTGLEHGNGEMLVDGQTVTLTAVWERVD